MFSDAIFSELLECVLAEAVMSLFTLIKEESFVNSMHNKLKVKDMLKQSPSSVSVLRVCDLYYSSVRAVDSSHALLEEDQFSEIYSRIHRNLSSPQHQVSLCELVELRCKDTWV